MTGRRLAARAAGVAARRSCLRRLLTAAAAGWAAPHSTGAGLPTPVQAAAIAAPLPTALAVPPLRRGFNLTHWFEYEQAQDVAPDELAGLRQLGLDHVRIPVDPVVGGWQPMAGIGGLEFKTPLRAAVETALTAGLDVVVDLHLTPDTKATLERSPRQEHALLALWSRIGRAFADLPPARLAFELYNEPQYYGAQAPRWPPQQLRLLAALRKQAPRHLVLLSGNEGGSLQGLRALPLVADAAVAYVFHYYEPFLFTHQGAHWLDTRYTTAGLRDNVRYPVVLQDGIAAGLRQPHPRAAQELAAYRAAGWDAARVRADFDAAGAHARQHGVRLLCNEFGVIRANVDPPSRQRWLADVRSAAEANGLGWTLWDYTDIFGITAQSAQPQHSGARTIDADALRALGLQRAPAR